MNVYGQLYRAQLEQLSADPTPGTTSRVFWQTSDSRAKLDTGSTILSMLANDQKIVIGTSGTAGNNVRVNRSAAATLEFLIGSDTTAEGVSTPANWAKLNSKLGGSLVDTYLDFTQTSSPANPAASTFRLFVKSDNEAYFRDSSGTEHPVTGSGAATAGQVATADGSGHVTWANADTGASNLLLNGGFDIWQRGTTRLIGTSSTGAYLADRWWCLNTLGTNAVVTLSRQAGGVDTSLYGLKYLITTAPTAAQATTNGIYQILSTFDSLRVYNQTTSFTVKVKAFNNVTQVGVQFMYRTSSGTPNVTIGSEQLVTVNSSTFSSATISNQAIGTTQTTSGVVGVRIRITAVSSGNIYDLNNGIQIEQAMWNIGGFATTFKRQNNNFGAELAACKRFYEKSYSYDVDPTTVTNLGANGGSANGTGTGSVFIQCRYNVEKDRVPSISFYSPGTGTVSNLYSLSSSSDLVCQETISGKTGFVVQNTAAAIDAQVYASHWTAEAEVNV